MKKNICLFILILSVLFLSFQNKSFATQAIPQLKKNADIKIENDDNKLSEKDIIERIILKNKFQKSPKNQINSFYKKYNRYSEKNNFEKLKKLYTDNYVNNDGFDKKTIFKMMETAAGTYKDIKYDTEIKNIEINGKYASVYVLETAIAKTDKISTKIQDTGFVTSNIEYIDYLVKEDNQWKIQSTNILSEEVQMKYGEAKNMTVEVTSPKCVPSGAEYEVSVWANTPDGAFALGSIVNEQIIFPQEEAKDVFRAIKSEKLARVLTANKNDNNEYTTVSIALTRAEVEPSAININMTGMAFAMKRINVMSTKEVLNVVK